MRKSRLIAIMLLLFVCISGHSKVFINGLYYKIDSFRRTAMVTFDNDFRYNGNPSANPNPDVHRYKGDIVIPDTIEPAYGFKCAVTGIDQCTFAKREITSVTIPKTLRLIRGSAFEGTGHVKIKITDLASWCRVINGDDIFYNNHCELLLNGEKITSLNIPNGVDSIGDWTFQYCTFDTITIPPSVVYVGDYAFDCKTSAVKISDMEAWKKINFYIPKSNPLYNGASLYLNGKKVESVMLSDSTLIKGSYSFAGCKGLKQVRIASDTKYVSNCEFYGCEDISMIKCYSEEPPEILNFVNLSYNMKQQLFSDDVYKNVWLQIPYGSYEKYREFKAGSYWPHVTGWEKFKHIVEMFPASVVGADGVAGRQGVNNRAVVSGGIMMVSGAGEDDEISVYGTSGQLLYRGTNTGVALPGRGVYIVKVGDKSLKVMN